MMAVLVALLAGVLSYAFMIREEYAPKAREAIR
jgi:hypothetical protein